MTDGQGREGVVVPDAGPRRSERGRGGRRCDWRATGGTRCWVPVTVRWASRSSVRGRDHLGAVISHFSGGDAEAQGAELPARGPVSVGCQPVGLPPLCGLAQRAARLPGSLTPRPRDGPWSPCREKGRWASSLGLGCVSRVVFNTDKLETT